MGQVVIEQEVLFNKEDSDGIPLTYADQIEDKSYWKGINQRAWDMIYPNITQLSTSEVEGMFLGGTLIGGEYSHLWSWLRVSPNVLAAMIVPRQERWDENRTSDKSKAWRIAFALADMSGEIRRSTLLYGTRCPKYRS